MVNKKCESSLELLSKCAALVHLEYLDKTNLSKVLDQKTYDKTRESCHKKLIKTIQNPIDMRAKVISQKHQKEPKHYTTRSPPPSYNESIERLSLKNTPNWPIQNGVSMCDFDIDEHFRRSLGSLYNKNSTHNQSSNVLQNEFEHQLSTEKENSNCAIKSIKDKTYLNEFDVEGYTVDEHFSKALGSDTWCKIRNEIHKNA